MKNINDRFRLLIQNTTNEHRRFKELEELTGISTATWKTFWSRGSNPSAQMIEEICQKFPQYAFWLVTGISDHCHGHDAPSLEKSFRRRTAAYDLFEKEIEFLEWRNRNPITQAQIDQYRLEKGSHDPRKLIEPSISGEIWNRIAQMDEFHFEITMLTHIRDDQEAALIRNTNQ